jgi:hypothetical protein
MEIPRWYSKNDPSELRLVLVDLNDVTGKYDD